LVGFLGDFKTPIFYSEINSPLEEKDKIIKIFKRQQVLPAQLCGVLRIIKNK
jgi:hypothetical protein